MTDIEVYDTLGALRSKALSGGAVDVVPGETKRIDGDKPLPPIIEMAHRVIDICSIRMKYRGE